MSINAFIPLIFGMFSLGAGLYVFSKARRSFLCFPYCLSSITVAGYFFIYFVSEYYQSAAAEHWVLFKLLTVITSFMVPALLCLLLILKKTNSGLLKSFIGFSVLLSLTSLMTPGHVFLSGKALLQKQGCFNMDIFPYYMFFLNISLFLPLGIVITLIKKSRTELTKLLQRQILTVVTCLVIFYFASTTKRTGCVIK